MRKAWNTDATKFYLLISPWIIGFLVFIAGPMLASVVISLTEWSLLRDPVFVGLDNYRNLFRDSRFTQSLRVTARYTLISVPIKILLALIIAMLLDRIKYFRNALRTVFYLPSVVSGVAVVVLWIWMFNPEIGLINYLLGLVGIPGPRWLYDPNWALEALIIMSFWGIGREIVIFLAALQGVPDRLREAAMIDGANSLQVIRNVTIPMISPAIFFNVVMDMISSFQVFTDAYVATEGGPLGATRVTVLYLYQQAFQQLRMGYASAIAWILFFIILFFTLLVFKSSSLWVYYESEVKGGA